MRGRKGGGEKTGAMLHPFPFSFFFSPRRKEESRNLASTERCDDANEEGGGEGEKEPNHQRWYAKWKISRNMYTLHARFFCTFGRCFAWSVGDY